ncbi:MAG: hypothetical protein H0V51_02085 [Chloroflexi bacterium]|nr:hypothetical protein [Chloroflexota bacterium]
MAPVRRFSRRRPARLPQLTAAGYLPPGHWPCAWDELIRRFGQGDQRQRLVPGLQAVLRELRRAGCLVAWIDGSFVTAVPNPVDVDVCYDHRGVALSVLDPILLPTPSARAAQRAHYGCEVFVAQMIEAETGRTFLEFFQQRKDGRGRKGLIELDPREAP